MALFEFVSPSAETKDGTEGDDTFVASNNNFGAGDRAFGHGGVDELLYVADTSLIGDNPNVVFNPSGDPVKTISGFQLNSVEVVTVTNDSNKTLLFDMSSSAGVTDLVTANGSNAVVFDQMTNLVNVRLVAPTFAGASNMTVGFQASVLTGATTVNLVLQDAPNGGIVRLGQATATLGNTTNTNIETVNITVLGGDSAIAQLNTNLTTLLISDTPGSAWDVTITAPLNPTVTTVTNNSDGDATVSAAGAAQAVTFTGGVGSENFTGTNFADTFNLGDGDNVIRTGQNGGALVDTAVTGVGNDTLQDQGALVNWTAGAGSDAYIGFRTPGSGNQLSATDMLDFGAGFDVAFMLAGVADANYAGVTAGTLEGIALAGSAGSTTLGANAQAAGVNSIFIGTGTAGNDTVNASAFTTGLSVTSAAGAANQDLTTLAGRLAQFNTFGTGGGNDTVTTGSAVDYFLWRGDGALTNGDDLRAGGQTNAGGSVLGDTLVLEGTINLAAGGSRGFRGFEFVALESAIGSAYRTQAPSNTFGNQYALTLDDTNIPSTGQLYINGSNLKGAVNNQNQDEFVNVNATAVTAFGLNVTTGGGADFVTLGVGTLASNIATGAGNDTVTDGGGNDVIDTGDGNDLVMLLNGGNNTVFDAGGTNRIQVWNTGNESIFTGAGNDLIEFNASANLTAADTLVDGGGIDGIWVNGGVSDGQFAGVNTGGFEGYEILFTSNGVYNLGANAARAGFLVVSDSSGSSTINLNSASFAKAMTVDITAGGNDVVNLGNVPSMAAPSLSAPTPANYFDFVGVNPPFYTGYFWPLAGNALPAGTTADRTGNANLVMVDNAGTVTVNGGTGSDVVRVLNNTWTAADTFAGGAGYDGMQLDNNGSPGVTAVVDLGMVTNVELFQTLGSGDRVANVADNDTNTITFQNGNINTLTILKLDNSALNDSGDVTRYQILNTLTDADYGFNIFGAQAGTTLFDKQNNGTNNNINFQGGAGVDLLRITGGDLGATTIFNGGGGNADAIIQWGGAQITDDDFFQVTNVEILTADAAFNINAILGGAAAASGMTTIQGTANGDTVRFDPAFSANLAIILGGGADNFNATGASGTMTFNENLGNLTNADTVVGGANGADVFNINAVGVAGQTGDLTRVDGIETYNITALGNATLDLTLGNFNNPVTGNALSTVNGTQTFNFIQNGLGNPIIVKIHGATENANTVVNLTNGNTNQVTLGSGNDVVNGGSSVDQIYGGGGADTLNGGGGNDQITGEAGGDTINGGTGNDWLRGQGGDDTINGDDGADRIYGGIGADVLNGGAGADLYIYAGGSVDSNSATGRDTVTVGLGDQFDLGIPLGNGAGQLNFVGNVANFGAAQGAVAAGGAIEAVFQSDDQILWVDVNNDGILNANDLQINVVFTEGVTSLSTASFAYTNFGPGFGAANFDMAFAGPI